MRTHTPTDVYKIIMRSDEIIMTLFNDGKRFTNNVQKIKFSIKDFFRNYAQIPRKLRISSHTHFKTR